MDYPLKSDLKRKDEETTSEKAIIIAEIEKLMHLYQLGKAPLSLILGFGEVTISRYLGGQEPSQAYSQVIHKALHSPAFMKEKLSENEKRISPAAYKKAALACENLISMMTISSELAQAIAVLFDQLQEVTPLSLQKLLYFAQGLHLARTNTPIFPEDCQAWIHGPVFPQVYELFKDFKYNPIEDDRFVLLEQEPVLEDGALQTLRLVGDTFGRYSGKVLEEITHQEKPWLKARGLLKEEEPSQITIEKAEMEKFFREMIYQYGLRDRKEVQHYIDERLIES